MIRAIIIDDELPSIKLNKQILEASHELIIVASSQDPNQALQLIDSHKPDIVFLDIKMPHIDGIELASLIMDVSSNTQIVFITAYEQYARAAFDIEALDYLLKPLMPHHTQRILQRMSRAKLITNRHINLLSLPPSQANLTIQTLGALKIMSNDQQEQVVRWRTNKTAELFAYLLLYNNHEVTKDRIMESLWPELDITQATSHLHTTVYKLKSSLQKANIQYELSFMEGAYRLKVFGVSIDLAQFNEFLQMKAKVNLLNAPIYEQKLSLYKGHLFGDKDYPWSMMERENYLSQFVAKSTQLAQFYLVQQDFQLAKKHLLKCLQHSPFDEETHHKLLEVYYLAGERAAFLKHYQNTLKLFRDELGIGPSLPIKKLYDQFSDENR